MRNAIWEATGVKNFVAGLLIFPDMPRNEHWERVALTHDHVYVICGLENIKADLESIAEEANFFYPPKPDHSENESRKANQLQYQGTGRQQEDGRRRETAPATPAMDGDGCLPLTVGSATFHIQHLDKMVVQNFYLNRDADGNVVLPQA